MKSKNNNNNKTSSTKSPSIASKVMGENGWMARHYNALAGAGAAVGLAAGGIGLMKSLANEKFSVIFLNSQGRPTQSTVGANSPLNAVKKVQMKVKGATKLRAFRLPGQDDESQEYYNSLSEGGSNGGMNQRQASNSGVNLNYYGLSNRYYSYEKKSSGFGKLLAVSLSTALAMKLIPAVVKSIATNSQIKNKEQLLNQRNSLLNQVSDKYNREGISQVSVDRATSLKYKNVLSKLTSQTLSLYEPKPGQTSMLDTRITPFIGLLRVVLIKGVHILLGTTLGADRRDFELCFDPDRIDSEEVAKDPFRTVIYKYKWPSHGFEVDELGRKDTVSLMNSVINFLSLNPKYLTIRV